ncbi:tripartite tricarboxylate transporter TctB family protein [Diaphorobacter aerolatus]|uniref:Tripartite tricarboxylate transporter TctB family protein n=1 Tax=Diaphorobacter aerolatus TaxID=1288495 RepID=A0A7H0GPQ5_9BURK|nr:tripartite tricarboxylate transporter TctB family protein [Diaphorobacter aerolatus]QNP50271.1 tripartite tricarboxylate transporter TctB family protein [Diaphorobacter aerolatus]
MTFNDRTLGVAALGLSAFLVWFGHDLETPFAYEPMGPRVFPMMLAAVIALCGVRLAVKGGNAARPNPPGANSRIALMVLIVVGYACLFQLLGFIIATALATACVGRLFDGPWIRSAIGGIVMGVCLYLLFDLVLDVVLPLGMLEAWL